MEGTISTHLRCAKTNTKTAVFFPNIFMVYNNIETQSLRKTVFKPTIWKRYIVDTFSLWDMSKPNIVAFFEKVNLTPYYEIHGRNIRLWDNLYRQSCIPRLAQHSTKKLSMMQRRILNENLPLYKRTSRKRPPKMQRLSGRLQESNHRGPLARRGSGTSNLWKIICCIQLRHVYFHVDTKVLRIF